MDVPVALPGGYNAAMILRQTPGGLGRWKSMMFGPNSAERRPRWLVVLDQVTPFIETSVPKERRILFVTEPPGCKVYPASYLNNFGTVVSPAPLRGYRGRHVLRQSGLPWWTGAGHFFDRTLETVPKFEDIAAMPVPKKPFALSVICSTHNLMPMHKRRIEFVKRIKAYFGDDLHWYGRGVRTMSDKSEAIDPYRYHITIENSKIDHFWTEKLADCFLGFSMPIYAGGTNVADYFPREAFEPIDIDQPEKAIATIKTVLESDPWYHRLSAIREARRRVLEEHNLFNLCHDLITGLEKEVPTFMPLANPEVIYPVPPPVADRWKAWERRQRRRLRAVLERQGWVRPKKSKWKALADTAVPDATRPPSVK